MGRTPRARISEAMGDDICFEASTYEGVRRCGRAEEVERENETYSGLSSTKDPNLLRTFLLERSSDEGAEVSGNGCVAGGESAGDGERLERGDGGDGGSAVEVGHDCWLESGCVDTVEVCFERVTDGWW